LKIQNNENLQKQKLNFNYKKQNIEIKPIAINSNLSARKDLISVFNLFFSKISYKCFNLQPTNRDKEIFSKHILKTNSNENNDSSLLHNSVNISKTHESFLPKMKKNSQEKDIASQNNNNILFTESYLKSEVNQKKNLEINRYIDIRLEDGVSINVIKSQGEKRIKKFLHIPDFEIYILKVS